MQVADQVKPDLTIGQAVERPDSFDELMAHDGVAFVQAAYLAILERSPDADGLATFTASLAAGATKVSVAYELATSEEAQSRPVNYSPIVAEIFKKKLEALVAGENGAKPTSQAVLDFAREQVRLHQSIGTRPLGKSGVADVDDALSAAKGVVAPVSFDELMAHDGAAFVEAAYLLFLERSADGQGLMAHMALFDQGATKVHVAYELARSDEAHARHTSGLPIARDVFQRKLAEAVADESVDPQLRALLHFSREHLIWSLPGVAADVEAAGPAPVILKASRDLGLRPGVGPSEAGAVVKRGTIWMDLTTAFEWKGGVVGIVRAELEVAAGMKRIDPSIRFSMQVGQGFAEIPASELDWLIKADNVVDAYMTFFGRYQDQGSAGQSISVAVPQEEGFFYPYSAGDMVLAMGWMDSQKETMFAKLKAERTDVYICYLIYDTILLNDTTRHFYSSVGQESFHAYMNWVSRHCDFLLFGGETAKADTEALHLRENWRSPPGQAVKFGTDIMKSVDADAEQALLEQIGVTGPFMIMVGTIEPRKNHDTLYRAYLLALEIDPDNVPQLVVCGKPMGRVGDLVDRLDRDPRLTGRLIHLAPTDSQLAALYKNCRFTLLPSIYEGWSLTLPESLGQGKFCLTCDTPPLREIGGDLVDYVGPFDVRSWAEKMILYGRDDDLVAAKEARIIAEWPTTRWLDTARMVHDAMVAFGDSHQPQLASLPPEDRPDPAEAPTIWMDLTLTYLHWQGGVLSGIVRTELTYAYYLKKLDDRTRFFAYVNSHGGYFFEIPPENLQWLFDATDLTSAYKSFHDFWEPLEASGQGYRDPIRSGLPSVSGPALINVFPNSSVIFFAGIDWHVTETSRTRDLSRVASRKQHIMTSQLLYDFTPILLPHLHLESTVTGYGPFVEAVSNTFDHLVYGGRTAQRDGLQIQKENGFLSPPSDFIEFGGDLTISTRNPKPVSGARARAILAELGITGPFVLTVGTIEPRKNHETLYKAYLHLLQTRALDNPLQLVIVGNKGWNSDDFLDTIKADQRVKGRIVLVSATDVQLDVLYRNCAFTLLPSFYEGWSLTLPESLRYQKFCLASDVEPLRETAGDLAEYIHPLDTYKWAECIAFYANHPDEVSKREARIRKEWQLKTWEDSARDLRDLLLRAHRAMFSPENPRRVAKSSRKPLAKAV